MKRIFRRIPLTFLVVLLILTASCEKFPQDEPRALSLEVLNGLAQKGPYLNGASISVSELNGQMAQTGRQFNAQISNNLGSFELKNLELVSQFVELVADGFYFNEVSSEASSARLILKAVANLQEKSSMNVNLLSHLEKDRVYHLIEDGMSFTEAKEQAQMEVLRIFSMEYEDMEDSEALDISGSGEDDAIMLAISLILQGYRSVAELSELLANISVDFQEDGFMDNEDIGSELVSQALWLETEEIRTGLEARYSELGLDVELADFELYLDVFLENTTWEARKGIIYPEYSEYGENILFSEKDSFSMYTDYSMAAELPSGTALTMRLSGGFWAYRAMPDGPVNWKISQYDSENRTQTFTARESGTSCDLAMQFGFFADSTGNMEVLAEFFENNADTASFSKILFVHQ